MQHNPYFNVPPSNKSSKDYIHEHSREMILIQEFNTHLCPFLKRTADTLNLITLKSFYTPKTASYATSL